MSPDPDVEQRLIEGLGRAATQVDGAGVDRRAVDRRVAERRHARTRQTRVLAVAAGILLVVARNCEFFVGRRVSATLDAAIAAVPPGVWVCARDTNGQVRRRAQVAELDVTLDTWPPGTRAICRREKPLPGVQLRLWDHDGLRHQIVLTNSEGDPVALELRHRRHADVEIRIRNLKDCGLKRMPFTAFAANAAWMELVLTAADLLAWCQLICLDGDLARAEPRTLRYRLLHTAGRLVHRARQVILRLPEHWPWSNDLAVAYQRLALLDT